MCLKDIIHQRRWFSSSSATVLPNGTRTVIAPASSRRLSATVTSLLAPAFSAGESTRIRLGNDVINLGTVAVLNMYNPSVTLRLSEYGSSLLGQLSAVTNAAGDDTVIVTELVTNEDDIQLTTNP